MNGMNRPPAGCAPRVRAVTSVPRRRPHPGSTYTLPPVHSADAAKRAPVASAGLQASLRRKTRA